MKKYCCIIAIIALMTSCKTTKSVVAESGAVSDAASSKIIAGHYDRKFDFSTLYIKANVRYQDPKQTQNVSAEIKIKKDEMILVSIRFLGFTVAKAIITPKEVKYYEKVGSKYFEGDYRTLSQWLGTDLDYTKVQNMLIGKAMDDLTRSKYRSTIENELYKLENTTGSVKKAFYFEGANYLIKKQEIAQPEQQRDLQVNYPAYKEYPEVILPLKVVIDAMQKEKKTNISIDYNTITFNEQLSFPYAVPEGYERIFID